MALLIEGAIEGRAAATDAALRNEGPGSAKLDIEDEEDVETAARPCLTMYRIASEDERRRRERI